MRNEITTMTKMYLLALEESPRLPSVSRLQSMVRRALTGAPTEDWSRVQRQESTDPRALLDAAQVIVGFNIALLQLRRAIGACVPLLFFSYGISTRAFLPLFECRELLNKGDAILYPSMRDFQSARRHFVADDLRSYVIPYPVDDCFFTESISRDEARAELRALGAEISNDGRLLVYVGRICPQKNIHLTLRLFAEVRRRIADAVLLLVGTTDCSTFLEMEWESSNYDRVCAQEIERLGIRDAVFWLPNFSPEQMPLVYAAADINVTCSTFRTEDYGFTTVEAAACGCPTVGTAWGGLNNTIIEGTTGYRMPTYCLGDCIVPDWRCGAHLVARLLQNHAERIRLGQRAQAFAWDSLRESMFAASFRAALADLAAVRPPAPASMAIQTVFDDATLEFFDALEARIDAGKTFSDARRGLFRDTNRTRVSEFLGPYAGSTLPSLSPSTLVYVPWQVEIDDRSVTVQDPNWKRTVPVSPLQAAILRKAVLPCSLERISLSLRAESHNVFAIGDKLINAGLMLPLTSDRSMIDTF